MVISVITFGSGLAWASIPDSTGEIHACYKKENGDLRVVDSATASCKAQEVALSWRQAGVPGPAGPPGLPGPPGPAGPEGAPGQGVRIIAGYVGGFDARIIGQGFTVKKHTDNRYGVVYDVIFPAGTWNGSKFPAMTVTPLNYSPHLAIIIPEAPGPESPPPDGSATFRVQIWNTQLGSVTDSDFSFIAVQI